MGNLILLLVCLAIERLSCFTAVSIKFGKGTDDLMEVQMQFFLQYFTMKSTKIFCFNYLCLLVFMFSDGGPIGMVLLPILKVYQTYFVCLFHSGFHVEKHYNDTIILYWYLASILPFLGI